jgi:hypothetical protein
MPGSEFAISILIELFREELAVQGGIQLHVACNSLRRVLDEFDPPANAPLTLPTMQPMTKHERACFEAETMIYGKHFGEKMGDIPRDYLEWLADAKHREWRQLRRYLMTN